MKKSPNFFDATKSFQIKFWMKFLSCWQDRNFIIFQFLPEPKIKSPIYAATVATFLQRRKQFQTGLFITSFLPKTMRKLWRKIFPTIQKFKDCAHSDFQDISNFPYKKLWGISMVFYHRVKITFLCYLIYVGKALNMDTTFLAWPHFWSTVIYV